MVKIIKRLTDKKYLQSLEDDIWVDDVKQSYAMTYRECESAKETLLETYTQDQIVEIADMSKSKPLTKEEIKELRGLLKK